MSDDDDKIFLAAVNAGRSYKDALYEVDKVRRNKAIVPNVNHDVRLWKVYVRYSKGWQEGLLTDSWERVMLFVQDNRWLDWHIEDVVPILSKAPESNLRAKLEIRKRDGDS